MEFSRVTPDDVTFFQRVVGEENVLTDKEALLKYGHDETEDLSFPPEVVIKPNATGEVSEILSYCNPKKIAVTPRGGGTGLSGGALPVFGGISLSLERMNRIIEIDEQNLQVTTEPGVITQVLQEAVIEKKLFYPPDPASRGSCFIGGNIAENSGGPKALKYGVVKDYVLNLEVVLPNGEVIWTGANVLKNSTGYNLTQLLVGSEGTLGVVTKIVLKLIPYPRYSMTMLVPFHSAEQACAAVSAIFQAGITPSALEFMEREAIDWTLKFVPDIALDVPPEIEAHLLVEVDGNHEELLFKECEEIAAVVEPFGAGEILFAENQKQKDDLWMLRRRVAEAVKANSVYKEEDTVVPRANLPALLKGVKEIGNKYGFRSVCYGHAGDGNLHVNIVKGKMADEDWHNNLSEGIGEIFRLTKSLGGTISGEHGIGLVQKSYLPIVFSNIELALMREIKRIFDPNEILNPGKIFPAIEH